MRVKSVETWPLQPIDGLQRFGYRITWEEEPGPENNASVRTWPLAPLDGLQRFGYEIRSRKAVNEP